MKMFRKDEGFTLVELMVVVLIIGILVAIAVPVFLNASANAQKKSCQANQRTIVGAIQTYNAQNEASQISSSSTTFQSDLVFDGTTAYKVLFDPASGTIKTPPTCPTTKGLYLGHGQDVIGDNGTTAGFAGNGSHQLGQ